MKQLQTAVLAFLLSLSFMACKKESPAQYHPDEYTYYEVGFKSENADWRDTAFVVRTKDPELIAAANAQLFLSLAERKIVLGDLGKGDNGYNKNGPFPFNWHFKDDGWSLVDVTVEIYDGKPYTDVHLNTGYWQDTMTRFGAWGSYLKRKLPGRP